MQDLTVQEYKRLVGYSNAVCKDQSIKHDLVHDAWISYTKYSKEFEGEEKLKILQHHIKQAFIKRFCRKSKEGKWVRKPMFYVQNIGKFSKGVDYQPEMVSVSSLQAIIKLFSSKGYKESRYSQKLFKTQSIQSIKKKERDGRRDSEGTS